MYTFIPPSIGHVDADPNWVEVSSGVIMKLSLELSGFVNHDIQDITALKIGVKSCIGLAIYISGAIKRMHSHRTKMIFY